MSGLAIIAKQLGFTVTGSDQTLVEPIYSELVAHDISITHGYDPQSINRLQADAFIIGNALSRGQPIIEAILNSNIPFYSGPQWLAQYVLHDRWVLAVSGTHGKTTTTSMLSWILDCGGLNPSYLIGGQPNNFKACARLTDSPFFVVEADEYDTAYFDKRPKFMHYSPRTLIVNNIEFDHADIFSDLPAIQQQFHYLIRLVPQLGLIIAPHDDDNVHTVLQKGCWTPTQLVGDDNHFHAVMQKEDGSCFDVYFDKTKLGTVLWNLIGRHNIRNALMAIAAARHVGILPEVAIAALNKFSGVQRRLELKGTVNGIKVYDDFAHHPTAIATTLQGLRAHIGNDARLIAVLQFGSHTMRAGVHEHEMMSAFTDADQVLMLRPPNAHTQLEKMIEQGKTAESISVSAGRSVVAGLYDSVEDIIQQLRQKCREGDHVLIMSNLGFDNIHQRFLNSLTEAEQQT